MQKNIWFRLDSLKMMFNVKFSESVFRKKIFNDVGIQCNKCNYFEEFDEYSKIFVDKICFCGGKLEIISLKEKLNNDKVIQCFRCKTIASSEECDMDYVNRLCSCGGKRLMLSRREAMKDNLCYPVDTNPSRVRFSPNGR